jgi:hypothetical protein
MKPMASREIYLEITYRRGKPLAGYLHLPRKKGSKAVRSKKFAQGLVVDFDEGDEPIGVEITSPSQVSLESMNAVLNELHLRGIGRQELAPLVAG